METIAEDAESEYELGNCVMQIGVNVWAMSRYGVVHCRRQIAIRFCVVCWFCGSPPHAVCRRHVTVPPLELSATSDDTAVCKVRATCHDTTRCTVRTTNSTLQPYAMRLAQCMQGVNIYLLVPAVTITSVCLVVALPRPSETDVKGAGHS